MVRRPSSSRPLLTKAGDRTCLRIATEVFLHLPVEQHSDQKPRLMKNTQSTCNGSLVLDKCRRKAQAARPEGPNSEASSSSCSINSGKRKPAPPRGAR